jgi:hypothetical protein
MSTTYRAAVMLAVLVGLPAAWVYYGPLPEGPQRAVDGFIAAAKEAIDWDKLTSSPADNLSLPVAESQTPIVSTAEPTAEPPRPSAEPTVQAQVAPLLHQFRQLGAASYQLEPWGDSQRHFRFWCDMPTAGGAATEQFEAIAADPLAAVEQVVTEVAAARRVSIARSESLTATRY